MEPGRYAHPFAHILLREAIGGSLAEQFGRSHAFTVQTDAAERNLQACIFHDYRLAAGIVAHFVILFGESVHPLHALLTARLALLGCPSMKVIPSV